MKRSTLVDQTEEALLAGLRSGQWSGLLPGVRLLCKALQVSPPTLQAATTRLLEKGVLISRGPRRRLEIAGDVPARNRTIAPSSPARKRRVLCLTDDPLPRMAHMRLEIISELRLPEWDFRHRVMPTTEAKVPRQQWDRLAETEEPDVLIVFGGRPAMAQWCLSRGIPTIFIGGDSGNIQIPVIGSSPKLPVEQSLQELIRLGHRAICMPMFGLFPRLEEALRETFREIFENAGLPFDPAWNTPSAPQSDPDIVTNTLTRVCRYRVPTAIVCLAWVEFVTIESFLRERRLTIPGDVSVILLSSSEAVSWARPTLTHFKYDAGRLVRTVRSWIKKGMPKLAAPVCIPSHMIRGNSIGPPRE